MNTGPQSSQDHLPLEARVPSPIEATPSHLNLGRDENPTWWTPGWDDVHQFVGWRWILLLPAVACVLVLFGGWYYPMFRAIAVFMGIKLGLLALAIAVSLAGYVTRMALRAGTEPFCIFCGYNLSGLPDHHRCPECGRSYSHAVIAEYRKDPHWFVERWKLSHSIPTPNAPFESGQVVRKHRARDGTE